MTLSIVASPHRKTASAVQYPTTPAVFRDTNTEDKLYNKIHTVLKAFSQKSVTAVYLTKLSVYTSQINL